MIRLILNPEAAEDVRLQDAIRVWQERRPGIEVVLSEARGDALRLAEEAAGGRIGRLIGAGGDGTLNELVNGIWRADGLSHCRIGLLPFGTANDFAGACGIPTDDPAAALQLAIEADPVSIDAGRLNDRLFVNVASGGFGAEVTATTPPEAKELLGRLAYLLTGLARLPEAESRHAALSGPDFEWAGDVLGIAVANARWAGGGIPVAPDALLNDRLLDVTVLPDAPLPDVLAMIRSLTGESAEEPPEGLVRKRVSWLQLTADQLFHVNADGEPMKGTDFRFDVHTEQILVCLPPDTPLLSVRNR